MNDGSQIAVIGGGPAGSFFSYFFLDLAERVGIEATVDIYEHKDFSCYGPPGCNHCGGIVSESLVQILSAEGINIPNNVLQRGIDSYILHMERGSTRIETLRKEKRIAAIYRGAGPRGTKETTWGSFDGFLQELAVNKGAYLVTDRVTGINFDSGRPEVTTRNGFSKTYDLIVGAVGLLNSSLKLFEESGFGYCPPRTTKTFICEFFLGHELVRRYFGSSMHVFLLNIPRLDFAALIPKGSHVTMVLLGKKIDKELVESFLHAPEVKQCFPPDLSLSDSYPCQCFPKINIKSAVKPFANRVVLIGDSATSKLYKNGIGAAYITAKAAATTAILHGVSYEDFKKHYWPVCKSISRDNLIGKAIFTFTSLIQKFRFAKRIIIRMVNKEQQKKNNNRQMSLILWDTFTGSAPYKSIFLRTLKPSFLFSLISESLMGILPIKNRHKMNENEAESGTLGKVYNNSEIIVKQGETGECMYVIQSGTVEIVQKNENKEVHLAELCENDFFGEMSIFEREVRSATVRAKGEVRVLTVDKKTLLGRIQEDPSLAFRIVQKMSSRIREMNIQLSRIKAADRRNWDTRIDKIENKK